MTSNSSPSIATTLSLAERHNALPWSVANGYLPLLPRERVSVDEPLYSLQAAGEIVAQVGGVEAAFGVELGWDLEYPSWRVGFRDGL